MLGWCIYVLIDVGFVLLLLEWLGGLLGLTVCCLLFG